MRHLPTAIIAGFMASSLTTTVLPMLRHVSLGGQLLAGDPRANLAYPTTNNMMRNAMESQGAVLTHIGSLGWWTIVGIGTVFFSMVFLRMLRRFV